MRLAFIGLGKLGLPVSVCLARAHNVVGYDADPRRMTKTLDYDPHEAGYPNGSFRDHLAEADRLSFADRLEDAVRDAEVIFVAVQTPHDPLFGGTHLLTDERADFDYTALTGVLCALANCIDPDQVVAVISTVLPGTLRRVNPGIKRLVYNPSFIAMGTVMRDFLNPEFVLVGSDSMIGASVVRTVYGDLSIWAPHQAVSLESAELAKVAYNAAIGVKLAVANVIGEIAQRVPGADADEVATVLEHAHRRVASGAYLRAGMGDGGACHPRDQMAMSWLARELGVHYDLFTAIMDEREQHAQWLAQMLGSWSFGHNLPIVILGIAYKAGSHLTDGSHALLVARCLDVIGQRCTLINRGEPVEPAVFLIGCAHEEIFSYRFPAGSVVIDPWRWVPDQEGVKVIRLGARR
jgi:UDPglucose 6-dehydrogenase